MAAALRAAEGGVYFFQILRGGIFKIFPARGYTPYPPIPDPWSIVSIMMSDIIEKVLNFELNPYISSMTIDDYCTQFCKVVYMLGYIEIFCDVY